LPLYNFDELPKQPSKPIQNVTLKILNALPKVNESTRVSNHRGVIRNAQVSIQEFKLTTINWKYQKQKLLSV